MVGRIRFLRRWGLWSVPNHPPDPARIARIVTDAKLLGCKAAAEKHDVSTKTVTRYLQAAADDETLSQKVLENIQKVEGNWLDTAKRVRSKLLTKIERMCEAADQDQLREVVGAYKIVNDGILIDQGMNEGDDGGRTESATSHEVPTREVSSAEGSEKGVQH